MEAGIAGAAGYPLWRTNGNGGLFLVRAGPAIWLGWDMLDHMIESMPLFPVALTSADFSACPAGHYEPGPGTVGAVLRFVTDNGRRLVYRVTRFSVIECGYEACWPD